MNVSIEGSNPSFSVQRTGAVRAPPPFAIPLSGEAAAEKDSRAYGVLVQTFARFWPTRIWPPGPSFQAYQLPFCEMMQ
jgi:hypothetical protein